MKKIIVSTIVIVLIASVSNMVIGESVNVNVDATAVNYAVGYVNNPPNTPARPQGDDQGEPGKEYKYTTVTTDPDLDMVQYGWNWTGGNIEELTVDEWTDPYESGETGWWITHTWDEEGTYQVRVKAKDVPHEAESGWSEPLAVTMPVNYQSSYQSTTTITTSYITTTSNSQISQSTTQITPLTGGQTNNN